MRVTFRQRAKRRLTCDMFVSDFTATGESLTSVLTHLTFVSESRTKWVTGPCLHLQTGGFQITECLCLNSCLALILIHRRRVEAYASTYPHI